MAGAGGASSKSNVMPREAQVIRSILKDMGVTDYEPAVINQLLDFTYKYTTEILDDAKAFSTHSGKKSIDVDDTKLAIQLKLDKSYTNPPPRELLLDVASHRNGQSLPLIKPYTGPKLPPDRYCLSAMNFQLRAGRGQAFSIQNIHGIRAGSRGASSLLNTSLVNRAAAVQQAAGSIRPMKTQTTARVSASGSFTSSQLTSQALASALSAGPAPAVKRKLEPDDDYDI